MLTTPPYLIGATLVFWGWQTGHLFTGILCAAAVEMTRFVKWRWEFSETDMCRVWDLCMILFAVAALYGYAVTDFAIGSYRVIPWAPVLLFPFLAATIYSGQDNVRFRTYFWMWRRKGRHVAPHKRLGWFVPYWYFTVCLVSASMANQRDGTSFAGVILLGGWLLWETRSRSVPTWLWAAAMMTIVTLSAIGQIGMSQLQSLMERMVGRVLVDMFADDTEIMQARTAIGSVGELKLSNRIMFRLASEKPHAPPERVRTAAFNSYESKDGGTSWTASSCPCKFAETSPGAELGEWFLAQSTRRTATANVAMHMPRRTGILPMPNGPTRLQELYADAVETNLFGSVRVKEGLSLVKYKVDYNNLSTLDGPPTEHDLTIPPGERDAVATVAASLDLEGRSPSEIMNRVHAFFAQQFAYRTYQKKRADGSTSTVSPLAHFLLSDRAGHCEYFASATALILRHAGIPTRYAIGYAVPAAAPGETVAVRGKDGHAWTLVYHDGAWRDFDTTPAGWQAFERHDRSLPQRVSDMMSWLRYQFLSWRYYTEPGTIMRILFWALIPVLIWMLWRIFRKQKRVVPDSHTSASPGLQPAGLDSDFYRLEESLAQAGWTRSTGEPVGDWLRRIESSARPVSNAGLLREIVALHYAYRFDPMGVTGDQRAALRENVDRWLAAFTPAR